MEDITTKNDDPLLDLLLEDVKAVDRQKLAFLLKGFIFFNKEDGEMSFTPEFNKLSNLDKIELLFSGDKARALIFTEGKEEGLIPKDILALDIMPQGSVKSSLKTLFDKRRVKKNKNGKYYLPNYRLPEIFERYEGLRGK